MVEVIASEERIVTIEGYCVIARPECAIMNDESFNAKGGERQQHKTRDRARWNRVTVLRACRGEQRVRHNGEGRPASGPRVTTRSLASLSAPLRPAHNPARPDCGRPVRLCDPLWGQPYPASADPR